VNFLSANQFFTPYHYKRRTNYEYLLM
jgi:hypothetical protein